MPLYSITTYQRIEQPINEAALDIVNYTYADLHNQIKANERVGIFQDAEEPAILGAFFDLTNRAVLYGDVDSYRKLVLLGSYGLYESFHRGDFDSALEEMMNPEITYLIHNSHNPELLDTRLTALVEIETASSHLQFLIASISQGYARRLRKDEERAYRLLYLNFTATIPWLHYEPLRYFSPQEAEVVHKSLTDLRKWGQFLKKGKNVNLIG